MNHGFFGFPDKSTNNVIDVVKFDSSSYYTIPRTASQLMIFAVGGGGGGGGGYRAGAGHAYGGGGGGGGRMTLLNVILDSFSPTGVAPNSGLIIQIGSGGAGGTGSTSNDGAATAGSAGGATSIKLAGRAGNLIYVSGGNGGNAGTASSGSAGSGLSPTMLNWYNSSVTIGAGGAGLRDLNSTGQDYLITGGTSWHGGGGGGGYQYLQGVACAGVTIAAGAAASNTTNPYYGPIDFAAGSAIYLGGTKGGGKGQDSYLQILGSFTPGVGGSGGGASTTTVGGNGGNGFRGSGGGGGGGTAPGFNGGTGGNGGNGYVCMVVFQ